MATGKNSYTLNVDIKQRMSNKTPRFVQYDSAQIIFKIYDSGKQYDLSPFTSAIVTHKLPNGKTIAGYAEFTELNGQRVVVYDYMGSEMEQEGNIETSVGLFVGDTQKVSIMPFNVEIVDDLGNHIDEDVEAKYSVLQVMMNEVTELNKTMTTNESTRQSNEATRRSQEIQRQTNEDTRKSNENTRINNENARKSEENTRKSNETTRESNEATRKTNESGRVSAENTRKSNETTRQNQESGRVSAESTRVSSENTRISAEDTRKSNETARQSAETARSNAEKTRGTNEDTRKANETTRLSNEDERKTAESGRKSAETTRESNETSRVSAEDTRKANETERQKQEGIRNTAETERLSNENARVSAERTRENQESTRQTQESTRQTNTNNAITRLDTAVNSTKLEFKAPVETKAALSTTYSNAQAGWVAQVTTGEDAGKFFRYNGSTWEFQSEIALDAVTDIQNKLHRTDRKTQTLIDGVNIVDAPIGSPTDIEIQGRTMVSLGNSNLEKGKYYALTDEKYKVITDGKTVSGVGKFQKGETHKTVADFKGKVQGSATENPHLYKYVLKDYSKDLIDPNSPFALNEGQGSINRVQTLNDGLESGGGSRSGAEEIGQQLFSFNVIEQVERTLGIIPGGTVADKVAWIAESISRFYVNWYGYGSGPSGNRATLSVWNKETKNWGYSVSHTNSSISRIGFPMNQEQYMPDENGFIHFLVFSEPSDGTTTSSIISDYINLEIDLKPTAQLNTRPTIVRVENFEGKVRHSTVENPHTAGNRTSSAELGIPNQIGAEPPLEGAFKEGDGSYVSISSNAVIGSFPQQKYEFDVVEAVERNVGKIPAIGRQEKADWLKENVERFRFYWSGKANSTTNTIRIRRWHYDADRWDNMGYETTNNVTVITPVEGARYDYIGSGSVIYLADGSPYDGVTSSDLHMDYVELEIHLKPTADFRQPRIPLYEVSKEEYDKIGISYSNDEVKRRYPTVQGVQHLVNPYVETPGENLLPPFTDQRWARGASTISYLDPYTVLIKGTATEQMNYYLNVKPNTSYTIGLEELSGAYHVRSADGKVEYLRGITTPESRTFTTDNNTTQIYIRPYVAYSDSQGSIFKNFMLTLGTEPKPFTPYNPSTLHTPITLSAVGDRRDVLYRDNGRWLLRKTIRTIEMTGKLDWRYLAGTGDYNTLVIPRLDDVLYGDFADTRVSVWDYTGRKMPRIIVAIDQYEGYRQMLNDPYVYVNVRKDKMGSISTTLPESYNDVKRYFNGWRTSTGRTVWESVTGNGQTATAEEALSTMPTDYTPYKLTYVLATPEVIDVTELVEGDIAVSGLTQIEVGAGEIVTEDEDGNRTYTRIPNSQKFNTTASPTRVNVSYEQNIRSAHDALVTKVSDNTNLLSIHERAIVNLFARMKGLELSVGKIRDDLGQLREDHDGLREDFNNLPEPTPPTEPTDPPTDGGTV